MSLKLNICHDHLHSSRLPELSFFPAISLHSLQKQDLAKKWEQITAHEPVLVTHEYETHFDDLPQGVKLLALWDGELASRVSVNTIMHDLSFMQ